MELLKTQRGYKIAYKGHMYTLQKICLNFIRWRCSKFSSLKCPCILKTCLNIDKPTFLTLNNDHVHEGNDNLIGAAKVKRLMIEKAKSSHATPSQIYSEIVANCTTNVLAELPREDYLKRSIRGNRGHNDPAKPKTINDITIEGKCNFSKLT